MSIIARYVKVNIPCLMKKYNVLTINKAFNINNCYCSSNDSKEKDTTTDDRKIGGFAKAFEKYTSDALAANENPQENRTFASLLRSSKFIDLGDPEGKILFGEIVHVVEDDLYIDFGWKFNCVCTRPNKNSDEYVRGAKVRIMVKDLELSTRFLGSDTDLTLLEADCRLLNIVYSPAKAQYSVQQ